MSDTLQPTPTPPARDFAADYCALLAARAQPIVPAVIGRLVGEMMDEVGRLRVEVAQLKDQNEWYAANRADHLRRTR